ncbi:MAG TPA: ABC-type transport auxiliary lipoprotein family protein [Hyphomicrobiaceae bacterium]|nr:ABC-type transport auxiliary lipoprotein family protein [Hyphomicrobiaceae bacterium]
METRARYVQVGGFTLSVIIAAFVFVYWLNSTTGFGTRSLYLVRFEGSVAGLIKGSTVLFNGVRVGEVSRLDLDPMAPRRVLATIAVDNGTPVRANTQVSIDFQGLTGSPVVALVGGTSQEPFTKQAGLPLLLADEQAGQSMSGAARDVLRRLDTILEDNAKPLKSMIGNLDTFAAALARNSDKLDGIVAGLERMTGGAAKARLAMYDLSGPVTIPPLPKVPTVQLTVLEPTALSVLDSDRIQRISAAGSFTAFTDAQWGDLLTKLVQVTLARSLEDAGLAATASRPTDSLTSDFQLALDIRKFQLAISQEGEIEIGVKLLDGTGRIVASRVVHASAPAQATTGAATAAALNRALASVTPELVAWIARAVDSSSTKTGPQRKAAGN